MAQPLLGRRNFADPSEPLAVTKFEVELPEAYRAGDQFSVVGHLNRYLTPYEKRVYDERPSRLNDHRYISGDQISFHLAALDDFSVSDLQDFLASLTAEAAEIQRTAKFEIDEVRRGIRELNDELSND